LALDSSLHTFPPPLPPPPPPVCSLQNSYRWYSRSADHTSDVFRRVAEGLLEDAASHVTSRIATDGCHRENEGELPLDAWGLAMEKKLDELNEAIMLFVPETTGQIPTIFRVKEGIGDEEDVHGGADDVHVAEKKERECLDVIDVSDEDD